MSSYNVIADVTVPAPVVVEVTPPAPIVVEVDFSVGGAGADGLSAYEVAVNNGFIGTEADWLASLVRGGGTSGPFFLPRPSLIDDEGEVYFYFGWATVAAGSWQIRRIERATAQSLDADVSNNAGFSTLADAWDDRTALAYA